ncbi:MAG TPA: LON peptidase substrate-binding domain-containing protein, partial [Candidatus Manganitrophaceae bacterium]|nr:LON peptidase substrate-binding domain-containing protein [Candidatus Manganitrophaceae bacterium]
MSPIEIPNWIPLFPLPNVVFFPKTYLPLHIFEPRYRQMVEESLQGDRIIGMILLKEGWEEDYNGNPPFYDTGTAGKIVRSQPLEDGTHDIILYGMTKFAVQQEDREKPYRRGRIRPIQEDLLEPIPAPLKEKLVDLAPRYHPKGKEELQTVLEMGLEDDALIATLCAGLPLTVLEKQFLLEAE